MKTWRLDTAQQTIVFASDGGVPWIAYWGSRLSERENLAQLVAAGAADLTGGVLDVVHPIRLFNLSGDAFLGQPSARIFDAAGPVYPRFAVSEVHQGKDSLSFLCEGGDVQLQLQITRQAEMFGFKTCLDAPKGTIIDWLAAPALPMPVWAKTVTDYTGKWVGEFQSQTQKLRTGTWMRESRTGRTGHETFPAFLIEGAQGVYGMHYAWSGGARMLVETLPDGQCQVLCGPSQDGGARSARAESATLWASFARDRASVAQSYQMHLRRLAPFQKPYRPVHYNCWEAIYFDHDLDTLKDIASRAAALGAERFVLDDGWFKDRKDDTTSLGDWVIDQQKYPDGLKPLIDHIHAEGMDFGLWFEPEMVNKDSDLYRAHPDWLLGDPAQTAGRGQFVLDLAQGEVLDYLFGCLDKLLSDYPIAYIKWDHNRVLPFPFAAQTVGFYALLHRLREAHPTLEIESCSSGGGRIDAGVLEYCTRVWLSDSNDAMERFRMQRDAAQFLPAAITGSHVGPRHCHTSGRILPMSTRAWVAASRHMGFEMDPRELTADEAAILSVVTAWYKDNRDWMHAGHIIALPQDVDTVLGEATLAADGSRFVAMVMQMEMMRTSAPLPQRLAGLDPDALYEVTLRNPEDAARVARAPIALKTGPLTLTGRALMDMGLQLPCADPATVWIIEGTRL